jgi:hypothetical protein
MTMASKADLPKRPPLSKERRAELRAKGELEFKEAAEFLEWSPGTFYNRLSQARKPGQAHRAPEGQKDHRDRLVFRVPVLESFMKRNSEKA